MTGAALDPATASLMMFGGFFLLLALRVPVAFALGLACLPVFVIEDRLTPQNLVQETFNAYNSFILLAVPFFSSWWHRARALVTVCSTAEEAKPLTADRASLRAS